MVFLRLLLVVIATSFAIPTLEAHAQQTSVPVNFHRQEHSLSCEIATLKMALGSHGIEVSEAELIGKLAFDLTPKSPGIWGDPDKGFVGNINGRMLVTGYGVYAKPIADVAQHYARTEIMSQPSAEKLARTVGDGNPVIIWGHYSSGTPYTWKTPAGKTVKAIDGEHTRLVYGFDGSVKTPTRFYLLDPLTGSFSWSTAELIGNWDSLNRMAAVISPRWVRVPGDSKIWELSSDGLSRRHVTSWDAFTKRGGKNEFVVPIAKSKLEKYIVGPDIT